MKENPALETLRAAAWRRPLTAAEIGEMRRRLGNAPEADDWQLETRLSLALSRLPDAEVPSNFTARVLAAATGKTAAPAPALPWWRRWVPRLALACAVLGLSVLGMKRYEAHSRQRMAESVAAISPLGALPSPETLADFDAIIRLGSEPPADVELLTLLQ
jgi:hypothetical protein